MRIRYGRQHRRWILTCIASIAWSMAAASALALDPPRKPLTGAYGEGERAELVARARKLGNQDVAPGLVQRLAHKLRRWELQQEGVPDDEIERILPRPPAWPGLTWMPSQGTVRVPALLIAFQDYPPIATDTADDVQAKLFGDGTGGYFPHESLRNFYRRSSYGRLDIQGDVLGWYTAPYARAEVEATIGRERLIAEALTHYDALGHDFAQYDNDGDGRIDYLIVVWTGPRGDWATFWWGLYMFSFGDASVLLDGKRLAGYSWQPESDYYPWGGFQPDVVIHETGHALGLPDLYDYDATTGPRGGVGGLDVMDSLWGGDHNAFSKILLEWIEPVAYNAGTHAVTASASGENPFAVMLFAKHAETDPYSELFVVQNRFRCGNDANLWGDGLLIWHVDATVDEAGTHFLFNNSFTDRKLVRLVQSDGLDHIESGLGGADAADYWLEGRTFGRETIPSSDFYDGTAGPLVTAIGPPGRTQSFVTSVKKKVNVK
jgi:M6 family metalloprotease-like protein